MKSLVVFLSLVVFVLGSSFEWKNCDPHTFSVLDMEIDPDPIQPGKTVTFTGTANQTSEISGGSWSISVHFHGIPLQKFTGGNCDGLLKNCSCPCEPDQTRPFVLALPVSIATPKRVSLTGKLTATDQNNHQIVCVESSFSVA
eukprot:TRINITY_DN1768_c0_g1_i1.p1 TRINITY_DN1768_c0_g1~~TRINITY_DN1768_c0_g1_i1.p1  ORF type:complete len:143 (+),score=23.28 TRINITY_DN1768_c0_g1_i1:115-543(+)